ncbi:MAG: hypothetical protein J6Y07_02045 [Alphaproteobacteria bacterium]|nr:hypothetical protein [Alphaproteobacteria bacterium]
MATEQEQNVPVNFIGINTCGAIGNIPQNELFKFYEELRNENTPYCVCREISFSIHANKNPDDTNQVFIVDGNRRSDRPLCVSKESWEKTQDARKYDCVKNITENKCPDPFMRRLVKLIEEKNK